MDEKELLTNDAAGEASKQLSDREMDSVAGGAGSVYGTEWMVAHHCNIFSAPQYKNEYWIGSIDAGSSLYKATPVNAEWMEFTVRIVPGIHTARKKQLTPTAYIQTKNVAKAYW